MCPTIRVVEWWPAPLRAEDASKTRILLRRVHLTEKSVYIFPLINCSAQQVNIYALPYQPTLLIEWNSSVIRGMVSK